MVQRVKWMQILSSYAIVRGKYKKIEPENILTEASTGQVWLTGFGICLASHSPRQRVIAGTFPYMAPEQTGRMNRSIDSRSDLYAYDITLLRDVYRSAPTRSDRPYGVGALPHSKAADSARRAAERDPRAGLGNYHEASRQERRGKVSNRRGGGG